jgi:hypothetical protein
MDRHSTSMRAPLPTRVMWGNFSAPGAEKLPRTLLAPA